MYGWKTLQLKSGKMCVTGPLYPPGHMLNPPQQHQLSEFKHSSHETIFNQVWPTDKQYISKEKTKTKEKKK